MSPTLPARARIPSVDALRGLIMIIMALDHVRDFFHTGAMSFQPDDLTRTTTAIFLTRWITHLCAPVFAFTAGVGAFLWLQRNRTREELSRFLWKRGLWLVLLELIAVRFAMFFSLTIGPIILTVLWSLGWSMVLLGFLARLPLRALAVLSVAVLLLHNVLDPVPAATLGSFAWLWNILYQPGVFRFGPLVFVAPYTVIPWASVMAAGFCFGPIVLLDQENRRKWLFRIGLSLTAGFLVLRFANIYGDPQPWSVQSTSSGTVLSFLRCSKYPPSLDFLLMTLGPAMLIWRWLDTIPLGRYNPLIVFGRTPLFYFIAHLFLIHGLTFVFALVRYGTASFLKDPPRSIGGSGSLYPAGYGYDLPAVYGIWLLAVLLLYPACRYISGLKERPTTHGSAMSERSRPS